MSGTLDRFRRMGAHWGVRRTTVVLAMGAAVAMAGVAPFAGEHASAREARARAAVYLGKRAPLADAPWIATITQVDEHGKAAKTIPGHALRCTAAVIGPKLVLTATHCIVSFDPAIEGIRVGTDDILANPGRVVPVARIWSPHVRARAVPHPAATDVALIETTKPLGVPAIALASERPRAGEAVTAFGFGDDRVEVGEDGIVRPFLRRWDAVALPQCPISVDQLSICASSGDSAGTRPGDSGGPLVVFRDGVSQLVGDTVQEADIGSLHASGFADVVAQRAFIATPPKRALVARMKKPIRIAGDRRPGGRVTCEVSFTPKPIYVDYTWQIGGDREKGDEVYFDSHGIRRHALSSFRDAFSQKRSITLPRGAGGKRLQCTARAFQGGGFDNVAIAVIPKLPRR